MAAGAVVPPGKSIPSGEVWGGSPAKLIRRLEEDESIFIIKSANTYAALAAVHAAENAKTFEEILVWPLASSVTRILRGCKNAALLKEHGWLIREYRYYANALPTGTDIETVYSQINYVWLMIKTLLLGTLRLAVAASNGLRVGGERKGGGGFAPHGARCRAHAHPGCQELPPQYHLEGANRPNYLVYVVCWHSMKRRW